MLDDTNPSDRSIEDQRHAYNAAFEELSLPWYWDGATCARFHGVNGLRAYLKAEQPHLLRAYDEDFLVHAIEAAKARCVAGLQQDRVPCARAADSFPGSFLSA